MSRRKHNANKPKLKQENGRIHIVEMGSYSRPEITEVYMEDWVAYGEDNDYFEFLIDRYNGSPTNNACINGVVEMIYGKGIDSVESEEKPQETEAVKELLHKECVKRVCYDFKMMGQAAVQIIYGRNKQIVQVEHMPVQLLRAGKCNKEGKIDKYYYHTNWQDVSRVNPPKKYDAFGYGNKRNVEILYIQPYRAGFKYYSPVDYQGGLQYAELEEEIANYHLSNIQNGLAPSMLINFNNGVPSQEERDAIERRIQHKFSGSSNAGRFILAFNDSKELAADIQPVILSDAHNQYQFLSDESMKKVMVSHRIVSPMLVGIKESQGMGNNAEELQTASTLMDNTVIRPIQVTILDAFEKILEHNGIELELYFKTLQPLEFTDLTNAITDEEIERETGIKGGNTEETIDINEI